ncbi:MAG TPA: DUF4159 domain-containing protein [Steroidobacteraceae bacterium]|jgi:hypothetical protein
MRLKPASYLRKLLYLALGVWPVLVAGSAPDRASTSPAVNGRWVLTVEHGEVFYKDDPKYEFQMARLIYSENPNFARNYGFYGGLRWTTDAPDAEIHLMQGVRRLTRVYAAPEGTAISLDDDDLFNHPFLYAVEVGGWDLSNAEAARLREYLDRGGFLIVDDFHGSYEWAGFMESMSRVFPDRPVVDIKNADELFHVLYDLNEHPQIPGLGSVLRGVTYEQDGVTPHWRGVYDEHNRLCVVINWNMDMGDAWENADNPLYPQPLTGIAYRFAINYVIYAMTH